MKLAMHTEIRACRFSVPLRYIPYIRTNENDSNTTCKQEKKEKEGHTVLTKKPAEEDKKLKKEV